MPVALKLGPHDHGRELSYEEFMEAKYDLGYRYEIIDGRLYVSPMPNVPENYVEQWLIDELKAYSRRRPSITNYVTNKSRIFLEDRPKTTVPEPDIAAFQKFPRGIPLLQIKWETLTPILVAEVLSGDDPDKDLERNPELFLDVPSIREYWVVDIRENPDEPTMTVFRRLGAKWKVIEVAFGETYTTKLLPGFKLILDPHR